MRIPIWPGVRLSVWEKQNPEAVQVRLPFADPLPVRRVLSMRGWMLLLVRYDWRRKGYRPSEADTLRERAEAAEEKIRQVRELHSESPQGMCVYCSEHDYPDHQVPWPCRTALILYVPPTGVQR